MFAIPQKGTWLFKYLKYCPLLNADIWRFSAFNYLKIAIVSAVVVPQLGSGQVASATFLFTFPPSAFIERREGIHGHLKMGPSIFFLLFLMC